MNTRFATPPYKRRGKSMVELLFVETGLRPVFFLNAVILNEVKDRVNYFVSHTALWCGIYVKFNALD